MALNYYLTDIRDYRKTCFLYKSAKGIEESGESLEWHKCNGWHEYEPPDGDVISHLAQQEEAPLLWRTNPTTEAIIWAAMAVDLGRITTPVRADRFYNRYLTVSSVLHPHAPRQFNRSDVHRHIGLRTNVTTVSNAQWIKRFFLNINHIQ